VARAAVKAAQLAAVTWMMKSRSNRQRFFIYKEQATLWSPCFFAL